MKNVAIAALLLLGACYEPDRESPEFQYGACNADWFDVGGYDMCQAPCESAEALHTATGDPCDHAVSFDRFGHKVEQPCGYTFEWEGVEGCCSNINRDIGFFACD